MASACREMWRYPVIEASGEERIKDGVAVLGVLYYQTEDLGSLYTLVLNRDWQRARLSYIYRIIQGSRSGQRKFFFFLNVIAKSQEGSSDDHRTSTSMNLDST